MKKAKLALFAVDFVFFFATIWIVLILTLQHQRAVVDQLWLISGQQEEPWPKLQWGVFSCLFVRLIDFASHVNHANLNDVVRSVAAVLFIGAFYLNARYLLKSQALMLLGLGLVVTSGFPMLWLSTEVFAGAMASLYMFFWLNSARPALTALAVCFFAFCKPDLILIGTFLAVWTFFSYSKRKERMEFVAVCMAIVVLLNLPGVFLNGIDAQLSMGRTFSVFRYHFAILAARFQVNPEWSHVEAPLHADYYRDALMPGATSMPDVILKYPRLYWTFVATSTGHAIAIFVFKLNVLLLLWGAAVFSFVKFRIIKQKIPDQLSKALQVACLFLIGVIPIILFSFAHIRYMSRFFPPFLVLALIYIEQFPFSSKRKKWACVGLLIIGLFLGPRQILDALTHPGQFTDIWPSD
jgi:hypothetical protein